MYGGKCLKVDPPVKEKFRVNRSGLSQELPRLDGESGMIHYRGMSRIWNRES